MTDQRITIWLDLTYTSIDRNESCETHHTLCKIDPYIITFRDSYNCINYITNLTKDKVILIITNETLLSSADNELLRLCCDLQQIDPVYIIYYNEVNVGHFIETSSKVHQVNRIQLQSFCDQLSRTPNFEQRCRRRRETFLRNDFTISTLSLPSVPLPTDCHVSVTVSSALNDHPIASQSSKTITKEDDEFIYGKLLGNILIGQKSTKQEMIEYCRQKCFNNQSDLNIIDEFEDYYHESTAIFWYTRDTFLYRLLNKALREQDVDTLSSMGCFIKDLDSQLAKNYIEQCLKVFTNNDQTPAISDIKTVYRGQLMNSEEFNKKIRNNKEGFFLVNGFLSTTCNENLAKIYAGNGSNNNESSILFKIDVDSDFKEFEYTDITKKSQFGESEQEILFAMGAVFKILSIPYNDSGVWNVHLKLTTEKNEEFRTLIERMREPIYDDYPLYRWANLMVRMGKYKQAEDSYLLLLDDQKVRSHSLLLPTIYEQLGLFYKRIGQYEKAIEYFEKYLQIKLKYLRSIDPNLASLYNNLANLCRDNHDYDKALVYYNKAKDVALEDPKSDQSQLAALCNNIGIVYKQKQDYSKALEMCEKALKILIKLMLIQHQSPTFYSVTFQVNSIQDYYHKSREYARNIFTIQSNSLETNYSITDTTNRNSALASYQQKYKTNLSCIKTSYEICWGNLIENYPDIPEDLINKSPFEKPTSTA